GKEQPFERGVSGNGSYLDHEAATSISGGSSLLFLVCYTHFSPKIFLLFSFLPPIKHILFNIL
ncbi:MAG TPA: hypothetical protein PLL17_08510, partial [Defluviitaleaceae bacterium]|nr:hypothetical protein [Defluviitaleaceae bacterium]